MGPEFESPLGHHRKRPQVVTVQPEAFLRDFLRMIARKRSTSIHSMPFMRLLLGGVRMSREAIGGNGAILGSGEYWSRVNRDTWFGGLMRQPSEGAYWEKLKEIGDRAAGAVEEIYEDLRKNEKRIQKIEASARTALAKQVRALYDVSRMAGTSCSHSGECKS